MTITHITVIGAGVMGAGIAAQAANAGFQVTLLDRPSDDPTNPNSIAQGAIEKLKKSSPAALMHPSFASRITAGNTRDDMAKAAKADWVIEAIIEKLEAKQALYAEVIKHRTGHTILSSNTSTIPLATLTAGLPKAVKSHFLITHFFNPPRYMQLLEVVTSPHTSTHVTTLITQVASERLGKTIVMAKDTPGFIANRIGTFWLHAAFTKALAQGIDPATADAVLGKPASVPNTGVFGLLDLVGLDIMPHVLGSMFSSLPATDAFHALGPTPPLLGTMIASGHTGRKGKGGFYARDDAKNTTVRNLLTGEYTPLQKPKLAAVAAAKRGGLRALITHPSPAGRYANSVLSATLAYSASLLGEIADTVADIDAGMTLGYNWLKGPLQLIDELGTDWFANHLGTMGIPVPAILTIAAGRPLYRTHQGTLEQLTLAGTYIAVPTPTLTLDDIKRRTKPIFSNVSAKVWNAGDGVAVLEFTSKMNTLDPFILAMLTKARTQLPRMGYKALVIHNTAPNFSVGANLLMLHVLAKLRLQFIIRWVLSHGQNTLMAMRHGSFPVVVAPQGMALGGGAEVVLHGHAVVASAETYIGLVEAGVGIIPGWGGCKELLGRAFTAQSAGKLPKGPMPAIAKTFQAIATATVAKSAFEARDLGFLTEADEVVMNPTHLLARAKAKALTLAENFTPPTPHTFPLAGPTARTALQLALHDFTLKGLATPHDGVVGTALAHVLSGGQTDITHPPLTEADLLKLERDHFITLTRTKGTLARIAHLLRTGKPLRN